MAPSAAGSGAGGESLELELVGSLERLQIPERKKCLVNK